MAETMDNLTRSATLTPATFNGEARTVEAVASTFAPVQRRDNRGPYLERLDPGGLDLAELIGAPVLDGHRSGSSRDAIGAVAAHRFEGGNLVVTIRLSGAPDAEPIVTRIQEGTIRGVSIGYRVKTWAEAIDPQSKNRTRTATAWTIAEVSAVPIPADSGATFRGADMALDDNENKQPDAVQTRAEIRTIARAANMTGEEADSMIDRGLSVTEARAEAFEAMRKRAAQIPAIRVGESHDDPAKVQARAADALTFRMAGGELKPEARDFVNMSLRDMAADSLVRRGVSVRGLSADDVFTRAMTESDFPLVVSNAMGKVALTAYQAAQSPLKTLARQRTLPSFKTSTSIRLGNLDRLDEMGESGEFTHTSRAENGETMSLKTYGKALSVSRKLLIDDDLGLMGDMTARFGQAAAVTEAEELVNLLVSNPAMSDGTGVFAATRGNVATTGIALDAANALAAVIDGRKAMRKYTGLDGNTLLDVKPAYLVCSPDYETDAEKLLASIYATTLADVNPMSGKLQLVVEPRLTGKPWYLFADPSRMPVLQYAFLSSAQGVQIQRTEAWDHLGLKFRCWLDFGVGVIDWRGAYYNAGA